MPVLGTSRNLSPFSGSIIVSNCLVSFHSPPTRQDESGAYKLLTEVLEFARIARAERLRAYGREVVELGVDA